MKVLVVGAGVIGSFNAGFFQDAVDVASSGQYPNHLTVR